MYYVLTWIYNMISGNYMHLYNVALSNSSAGHVPSCCICVLKSTNSLNIDDVMDKQ